MLHLISVCLSDKGTVTRAGCDGHPGEALSWAANGPGAWSHLPLCSHALL